METCYLCNKQHNELDNTHRIVRKHGKDKLWDGYYRPRLTADEMWKLPENKEVTICTNRSACLKRQHS